MNLKTITTALFCLSTLFLPAAHAEGWADMEADFKPAPKISLSKPAMDFSIPTETGLQAPYSVNLAPIGKQSFTLGFGKGAESPYVTGYLSRPAAQSLPYTATSAVDINVVGDPVGAAFGGCTSCGRGGGGSGSSGQPSCPEVKVPDDCYGCFPVVNTHNGCVMGYKNANETWRAFWTGASGHIHPDWLPEGEVCLQQMIDAGMDPDSTGIPFGMGM